MAHETLRRHMHRQLVMPARVGAQLGVASGQVLALAAGEPVTLSADQLAMIGAHPTKDAVDLTSSAWWTLTAADVLTPADAP